MLTARVEDYEVTKMNITFEGVELELDASLVEASPAEIRQQITEFECGDRREFDLAISFPNSFTGDVMAGMAKIPYGQSRTYGDLAAQLGSSPVAVGQACSRNPIPIVVPCHRVVGENSLGGFSAGGDRSMALKRALLTCENSGAKAAQTTLIPHQ